MRRTTPLGLLVTARSLSAWVRSGSAQPCQLLPEPRRRILLGSARAGHPVGLAAQAAPRCRVVDELLGTAGQLAFAQVVVLALQVVTRLGRAMPAAIALETAAGLLQRLHQPLDLALHRRAGRGLNRRGRSEQQSEQEPALHARALNQPWIADGTSRCARPET